MARGVKILFILEDLCFGGTQKQNLELALRLDKNIFCPHMLTFTGPTDMDRQAIEGDIKLKNMGSGRGLAPMFFLRLQAELKKIAPDIIVPCTALPNIWGRIWGRVLKVPVIVGTCRGGGAPVRQHERLLWRLTDAIVCNSQALRQKMSDLGVPLSRLHYIPNGVDVDKFQPAGQYPPDQLIVCVARLAKDKDHPTLIRAFAEVVKKFPAAKLRLVGEGPEEAHLRKVVASLAPETAAAVQFAGASSNTAPHYRDGAIFALSSIQEGQPNVILEAMSSGLPVCASNVGGIPGLVQNGVNGLLIPAGDYMTLAKNICTLLENPDMARNFGLAGRKIVTESYSYAAMVQAHQNLFLNLWDQYLQVKKQ